MIIQSSFLVIVSLTTLLLFLLVGVGPVSNAFSQIYKQERITINLLQDSSPRFFECGTTPTNGSSSLNGLNPEESAQKLLTDKNPDTAIMGDARFTVNFSEPLINLPGPDLRVIELAGAESFRVSVNASTNGDNSISVFPQPLNEANSCTYALNEALIDLQEFGIPENSSVSFISIDNQGVEDTLFGSDIADISVIGASGNNNSMSLFDTQTILLGGKSLPENDYIPLYDSTPYNIMTGHIVANIPCDDDNGTDVNVLIGQAPNLVPADLEFIDSLSGSGDLCRYQAHIASNDTTPITDIAIANNSTDDIDFPETSSILMKVGINPE